LDLSEEKIRQIIPDVADFVMPLEASHRDVMLNLILCWAEIDGAVRILLADVSGIPLTEAANKFGFSSSAKNLKQIRRAFGSCEGFADSTIVSEKLHKYEAAFNEYSDIRHAIAHSKCLGYYMTNREYILFSTFKQVSSEMMALDWIKVSDMQAAITWGNEYRKLLTRLSEILHSRVDES